MFDANTRAIIVVDGREKCPHKTHYMDFSTNTATLDMIYDNCQNII
jgi:hypothetical protein